MILSTLDPVQRIALVAPLTEPVPPRKYGGTERVVSVLAEELVRRGKQVTLFASGDSETSATLVPCSDRSLRTDKTVIDHNAFTFAQMATVESMAEQFDVIHNHLDYFAFPLARLVKTPLVTTMHGRLDLPEVQRLHDIYRDQHLVAISHDQQLHLPTTNWAGMVYNAIDTTHFTFRPDQGDYLVFLGRISPEKRPDRAIRIAQETGIRLVMAAKIDPVDGDYWENSIKPLVKANTGLVEYIGEIDETTKNDVLGGAYANLFPIDWPEPFGLTMVESMATGTPVIALRAGSVPEVVNDGVTGFICSTVQEMVSAVSRIDEIDRWACRAWVEEQFSASVMADGYERIFETIAGYPTPNDVMVTSRSLSQFDHSRGNLSPV